MKTNVLSLVITLTLGIILIGAVLAPVVSDAKNAGATSYSNGTVLMNEATGSVEMILSDQNSIVSDGEAITGYDYPAILTDTCWIAMNNGGINIFWVENDSGKWSAMAGANVVIDTTTKTVNLTNITYASSNNNLTSDTLSIEYSETCVYRSINGDKAAVSSNDLSSIRVLETSQIYGVNFLSDTFYFWNGTNVITNGTLNEGAGTVTYTDATPAEFKSIAVAYEDKAPQWIIVPSKIWSNGALDDGSYNLIAAIPILACIALVIIAANAIISRND